MAKAHTAIDEKMRVATVVNVSGNEQSYTLSLGAPGTVSLAPKAQRPHAAERMRFNVYGAPGQVDTARHILYGVSAMQAVEALGHGLVIDRVTLAQFATLANAKANGLKSRFTHPGLSADGLGKQLGRMRNFRIQGDKVLGDLHLSESAARSPHGDLRAYIESLAAEDPEAFGMSVVVDGGRVWVMNDGTEQEATDNRPPAGARDKYPALRVTEAYAVDAVDEPAANRDGLFGAVEVFGAFNGTTNELAAAVYDLVDARYTPADVEVFLSTGDLPVELAVLVEAYDIDDEKARVFAAHYLEHRRRHNAPARINLATARQESGAAQMESEPMTEITPVIEAGAAAQVAVAAQNPPAPVADGAQAAEWLNALKGSAATAMIQASGLPAPVQARLQKQVYDSPAAVEQAIGDARAELAALNEANVVQIGGRAPRDIRVSDPIEDAGQIVNWMFGIQGMPTPAANVRRLSDLYIALTGDVEFRGIFDPSRIMFAAANTSTLTNLVVDAVNKVIVQQMMRLDHYRWYERVVSVEPNDGTLRDMKWITLGGLSNLPTVAEGASYSELTPDDAKETSAFVKKGAYVGITREAIKNSNIQELQAIPKGLANAAIRTRSAAVSALFTANSGVGPTLAQDSIALFETNTHKNLLTTALGTDATAWRAARKECFKHTEIQSGAQLGIYPRFLLVPADLYDTALAILGYGEGMPTAYTPEAQDRGFADPRPIPLTVPDWSDATDWAYIVDPAVYPVIQMSYSQAPGGGQHPAPEVFSATSETGGLLFTNDTLPVKIRDEFAVGVNGPRGIGKRNVAG